MSSPCPFSWICWLSVSSVVPALIGSLLFLTSFEIRIPFVMHWSNCHDYLRTMVVPDRHRYECLLILSCHSLGMIHGNSHAPRTSTSAMHHRLYFFQRLVVFGAFFFSLSLSFVLFLKTMYTLVMLSGLLFFLHDC